MNETKKSHGLDAFTILLILIAVMAALTWVLPPGKYIYLENTNGVMSPIAGSYLSAEKNPQGILDILRAPIEGIYDAVDVIVYIMMIGAFLGVVMEAGALDSAIIMLVNKLRGREAILIIALTFFFGLGGTTYGMGEETIAFYPLIVPIVMASGYDTLTAVSIILLGSATGCLASTVNPFATGIASAFAQISLGQGLPLRFAMFVVLIVAAIVYTLIYATRVKSNPERSLVYDSREEDTRYFLSGGDEGLSSFTMSGRVRAASIVFVLTFAFMIFALIPFKDFGINFIPTLGWSFTELSIYFLFMSIVMGIVAGLNQKEIIDSMMGGIGDIMMVALIIGVSRGITYIMDSGNITATVLHYGESSVVHFGRLPFTLISYVLFMPLSFLIPSTSGLAALVMPIFAPLADFAGVGRQVVVTAYQSASGFMNLITPTSGIVVGGLAMARVNYGKWLKYVWKYLIIVTIFNIAFLTLSVYFGW